MFFELESSYLILKINGSTYCDGIFPQLVYFITFLVKIISLIKSSKSLKIL